MWEKVKVILGSVRFWQLALIAAIEVGKGVGLVDGASAEAWARGIELLLGGSVTIGTLDSIAKGFSGTK